MTRSSGFSIHILSDLNNFILENTNYNKYTHRNMDPFITQFDTVYPEYGIRNRNDVMNDNIFTALY